MKYKLYLLFFLLGNQYLFAYNEEKMDSLGNINHAHSTRERHSTFHYELVKLLAVKAGFPADSAEVIARYSALVDQANPKPGYPYPLAIDVALVDTFSLWAESIAGTERTAPGINRLGENAGVYWHFPLRNPMDSLTTGAMVYATDFPHPVAVSYKGPSNFWRVPFSYYLDSIYNWAINGTGRSGNPNGAPKDVYYFDVAAGQYQLVPGASIIALGILLHSIGDCFSHEECMVTDTIRSHPDEPYLCSTNYHHLELPYDNPGYGYAHIDKSAQALWRALRAYAQARGYNYQPLWADNNSNNIPDELEETGSPNHNATFIERWKDAETQDLNTDGRINHYDHTVRRIGLAEAEIATALPTELPTDVFEVFPNPANGKVHVRTYGAGHSQKIIVQDIMGKTQSETTITGNDADVALSSLSNGIYFITIGNTTKKIVVNN